jgi:hypothetical protein
MTTTERKRYIQTVKKASTHPAYKERYEKLLTLHKNIFFSRIHELDFFLPWHRWFVLQYENLLREIDCRITVPFWDWSLVGKVDDHYDYFCLRCSSVCAKLAQTVRNTVAHVAIL